MLTNISLILFSSLLVYLDLKYRKIFNIIAYPLICAAVALNTYIYGSTGILYSLIGFTAGVLTGYIAYKLNFSGFGEFKLLALVGILKGYYFILFIGIISYILVSATQILNLISSGTIKTIIHNSKVYLDLVLQYGISISTIIDEHIEKVIVPYSIVILISIILGLGLGM